MDGIALLTKARSAGLRVRAEGNCLRLDGPRRLEPLARALLARKAEVLEGLAVEEAEVAWRVGRMLPQVSTRGPIPFFVARQTRGGADTCASCGEAVGAGKIRCYLCVAAAEQVLNAVREEVVLTASSGVSATGKHQGEAGDVPPRSQAPAPSTPSSDHHSLESC